MKLDFEIAVDQQTFGPVTELSRVSGLRVPTGAGQPLPIFGQFMAYFFDLRLLKNLAAKFRSLCAAKNVLRPKSKIRFLQ